MPQQQPGREEREGKKVMTWHPDMWIPPAISDETAKKQARGQEQSVLIVRGC